VEVNHVMPVEWHVLFAAVNNNNGLLHVPEIGCQLRSFQSRDERSKKNYEDLKLERRAFTNLVLGNQYTYKM
jgi:hypothetical protein